MSTTISSLHLMLLQNKLFLPLIVAWFGPHLRTCNIPPKFARTSTYCTSTHWILSAPRFGLATRLGAFARKSFLPNESTKVRGAMCAINGIPVRMPCCRRFMFELSSSAKTTPMSNQRRHRKKAIPQSRHPAPSQRLLSKVADIEEYENDGGAVFRVLQIKKSSRPDRP